MRRQRQSGRGSHDGILPSVTWCDAGGSHAASGRGLLGFARLLVHQPHWILTRDASSALSQEAETALFRTIREALPHAVLITMTHRAMAAWMFNRRIALSTPAPVP